MCVLLYLYRMDVPAESSLQTRTGLFQVSPHTSSTLLEWSKLQQQSSGLC